MEGYRPGSIIRWLVLDYFACFLSGYLHSEGQGIGNGSESYVFVKHVQHWKGKGQVVVMHSRVNDSCLTTNNYIESFFLRGI